MTLFTSRYPGAPQSEIVDDYNIVRAGGQETCRFYAASWLSRRRAEFDVVVDEVNTLPFFSRWLAHRVALLSMQTAREVWLAETPPLVATLGFALEPLYMGIYRGAPIITISASTAESLVQLGLHGSAKIIGVAVEPAWPGVEAKPVPGRIGYVGRITRAKRVGDIVRSISILRRVVPTAHLVVIGSGDAPEVQHLRRLAARLGIADAIEFAGKVDDQVRDAAVASFDVIAMASVREGWGLAISEAGRFAVPGAVYPVPGLREAVEDNVSGVQAADCTPAALAEAIARIVTDRALRDRLGAGARAAAERLTPERLVDRFEAACLEIAAAPAGR